MGKRSDDAIAGDKHVVTGADASAAPHMYKFRKCTARADAGTVRVVDCQPRINDRSSTQDSKSGFPTRFTEHARLPFNWTSKPSHTEAAEAQ